MTTHDPVEMNLKHKTDVMSWADVPWEDCDLNFRPPSLSRLSLSVGAVYVQLLLAAGVSVVSLVVLVRGLVPMIMVRTSWIEVYVIAAVIAALVTSGWYRPLPRVCGKQDTAGTGVLVATSVIGLYGARRLCRAHTSFDVGLVLLFTLAIPSCLCFADQLTGHMLYWWSADPSVSRNTMVAWRNAWCGRFITPHVDRLTEVGLQRKRVAELTRYWLGHVAVVAVYALSSVISILICLRIRLAEVGIVFLILSTVLLFVVAAWAERRSLKGQQKLPQILGQWFLYLKDSAQPPWVMQSPAGPQLIRAFRAYSAVGLLAVSFLMLGVAASPPTSGLYSLRSGTVTEEILLAGGAVLLAPLHCLLICFVVSAPTLAVVEVGFLIQKLKQTGATQ